MDKIRIGNDIIVNWDITRIGKPEDLESKKDFIVDTYTNGKIIVDIDEAGKYSVCPHLNINEGSIEMLFSPLVSNDGISQMIIRVTKGSRLGRANY